MNNRGKDRKMAYRCNQAIAGGVKDAIRCKVSGSICAHQYYCEMQGRKVLSAGALDCPARDGKLPEDPKAAPGTPRRCAYCDMAGSMTRRPATREPVYMGSGSP